MIYKLAFHRATPEDLERFWCWVRRGEPDGCWPWLGSTVKGYGRFKFRGHMVIASRFIYEQTYGPVGDNDVDHVCERNICCNLRHLESVPHHLNAIRGKQRDSALEELLSGAKCQSR